MAPKYQAIADLLRSEIDGGLYSQRMLLPTERILCQRFQVSRQTARRALAQLEAEGLITRIRGSGSHLRDRSGLEPERNRSVAVVTTYISDYIFPSILREVETVLSANRCTPLLFATQSQLSVERKVLQTLLNMKQLDGVLVEGTKTALPNPNLDLYAQLMDRGIPLVFINGVYPELSHVPSVLDDNSGGGRRLAEYLHHKGHRSIAGIFKSDDMQGLQRYRGYAEALRDLHLPVEDKQVLWYNTESKPFIFSDKYMGRWLDALEHFTAVVCYNDEVAMRLVGHLHRRGKRIPEEMAVVSFDNSQYSELPPLRITSLSHGPYNVGCMAAELLLGLFQGGEGQHILAPWTLMEKESS